MLTNVIPQKPLTGKSFATMFTHQRLCSEEWRKSTEVRMFAIRLAHLRPRKKGVSCSPTGSACLCRWSNSFVLLENKLPHVGQATSLSWVWLRMCSRKRYLILKKASHPVIVTQSIDKVRCKVRHTVPGTPLWSPLTQSYLSSGRRGPAAVLVRETAALHFQRDCPHVGRTTLDC